MKRLVFALLLLPGIITAMTLTSEHKRETYVTVEGSSGPLKGTLLTPDNAANKKLILIVPGSGAVDRDGNSPIGIKAAPYRLLAEGLSGQNISSVRIDKRGLFASSEAAKDPNAVTIQNYVDDVNSWITELKKTQHVPCIWLLGHSEGGLISSIAAKKNTDVCGLILISAPGRPLGEVLRAQLAANPANLPLMPEVDKAISQLRKGKFVDISNYSDPLKKLFNPAVQDFMISLFSYSPADILRGYDKPILIIQGKNDLQIELEDAENLAKSCACAKLVTIQHMNHELKDVRDGDVQANKASYFDPSLPLDPDLVPAIVSFIQKY